MIIIKEGTLVGQPYSDPAKLIMECGFCRTPESPYYKQYTYIYAFAGRLVEVNKQEKTMIEAVRNKEEICTLYNSCYGGTHSRNKDGRVEVLIYISNIINSFKDAYPQVFKKFLRAKEIFNKTTIGKGNIEPSEEEEEEFTTQIRDIALFCGVHIAHAVKRSVTTTLELPIYKKDAGPNPAPVGTFNY